MMDINIVRTSEDALQIYSHKTMVMIKTFGCVPIERLEALVSLLEQYLLAYIIMKNDCPEHLPAETTMKTFPKIYVVKGIP